MTRAKACSTEDHRVRAVTEGVPPDPGSDRGS
jgi:hypothetical protein